jgi:hypothetical protein
VRSAIETFTKPGETVLDPYVGGGTSLVEALALGRNGIGIDISALAEFVTLVKTTIYRDVEFDQLESWVQRFESNRMAWHGSQLFVQKQTLCVDDGTSAKCHKQSSEILSENGQFTQAPGMCGINWATETMPCAY